MVSADDLLGLVEAGAEAAAAAATTEPPTSPEKIAEDKAAAPAAAPAQKAADTRDESNDQVLTPAVRRLVKELNLDASKIKGSGKNGRILKSDVMAFLDQQATPGDDPDLRAAAPHAASKVFRLRYPGATSTAASASSRASINWFPSLRRWEI